jgi:hypothetical protein
MKRCSVQSSRRLILDFSNSGLCPESREHLSTTTVSLHVHTLLLLPEKHMQNGCSASLGPTCSSMSQPCQPNATGVSKDTRISLAMPFITAKDSVAFVTGNQQKNGIGRAIVDRSSQYGAKKVYATARNVSSKTLSPPTTESSRCCRPM